MYLLGTVEADQNIEHLRQTPGHKIPIRWSTVQIHTSADSLGCPLSDEKW